MRYDKKKIFAGLLFGYFVFLTGTLFAADPYMVKQISPMDSYGSLAAGTEILGIGGVAYFIADDLISGEELWKTDGTAEGTILVKDIKPGADPSYPQFLTNVNGILFFRADDGVHGCELWKSDGTAAGTVMVKDIAMGEYYPSSFPHNLTEVNGTLFFSAGFSSLDDGTMGIELWRSDGTEAGTVLVKDIDPGFDSSCPQDLTNVNGTLFFRASDGLDSHGYELWKSDGTETGTALVKDIYPGTSINSSYPEDLTNVNGTLFFSADDGVNGRELWRSDGSEAGTVMVKNILAGSSSSSYPINLVNIGGTLFFSAGDAVNGSELWKSDGTEAGTVMVKDIQSGYESSLPRFLTDVGGILFFIAGSGSGRELWKSDGTESGTAIVKDINASGDSYPKNLTSVNGTLFFRADDGNNGFELWKSDGTTAGTVQVKDIFPGASSSYPQFLKNVNGTLFFAANDCVHGTELWKTDGTALGTTLVNNVSSSFEPGISGDAGGKFFITASEGTPDRELWTSDGTGPGTVRVKDILAGAGASDPYWMTDVNGTMFFSAEDGVNGRELWKSDGTEAGTVMVKDIRTEESYPSSDPEELTNVGGILFFSVIDEGGWCRDLWKSDGTEAGTILVKDFSSCEMGFPRCLKNVGGILFFIRGYALWKSDGTPAGTVNVKNIQAANLIDVNGTLFFSPYNRELWKSDGTEAGSVLVKSFNNGLDGLENLSNAEGALFFSADDGTSGSELWKSDGTTNGTEQVKDINTGPLPSDPENLMSANGILFFTADDGINGRELWMSDGTTAGTVMVKDIYPGAASSVPYYLTVSGRNAFFIADDGTSGRELWMSDGTEAGTARLTDINAGSASSGIGNLTISGSRLFFTADSFSSGEWLWAYDLPAAPPVPVVTANNTAEDLDICVDTGVRVTWPQDPDDWNDGGVGTRNYQVRRGGSVIATLPYGTTEYIDNAGLDSCLFLYQVRYWNGLWASTSTNGISAADSTIPLPTILTEYLPACAPKILSTQSFSGYQWYLNGSPIQGATGQSYTAVEAGTYTVFVTNAWGCSAESPGFYVYSYPVPVVSGPSFGCLSVQLTTGTFSSYRWYKNGSSISGATSQNYTATTNGTYSVRVSNAGGCYTTSPGHVVTISGYPSTPVISGLATGCPSVELTTGIFASYQWILNDTDIPGAISQNYTAILSGVYKVRVANAGGCARTSSGKAVTINFCREAEVSPSGASFPARLVKDELSSTGYYIYFQKISNAEGYNIYEGNLDLWYSHASQPGNLCNAAVTDLGTGEMKAEIAPGDGGHYYLVTAFGGTAESISGYDSNIVEIDPSLSSCPP